MKSKLVVLMVALLVLPVLGGCAVPEKRGANAPLQTEGEIAPPPGCEDLRKRGGAC